VRVVEYDGMLPPVGFSLRCDPAGGTVPHPAHICAAIRRDPALLYSFPGPDHSCPFGEPTISVTGTWQHRRLHSTFSVCTGGQEQSAGEWSALLPSEAEQSTVDVDRGIGLIRLGDPEGPVLDLLRGLRPAPAWCGSCTRTFRAGYSVGYGSGPVVPAQWRVHFLAGRVGAVAGNVGLSVDGRYAASWFRALSRELHGWRTVRCGAVRELVHTSDAGSTAIVWTRFFERLVVSAAPLGCPAVA